VPMIAPVAQKLLEPIVGHDAALIWFGVMLCVNMQTSFMHPPFGFALFYLRGVAPKEVKSSDIYWGAVPWVLLQVIMVAIVIFFPFSVTAFLDKQQNVDLDKVKIEIPQDDGSGGNSGAGNSPSDPSNDIQKALGGSDSNAPAPAEAPKGDAAPGGDAPKADGAAKDAAKPADDKATNEIEKAIREGNK